MSNIKINELTGQFVFLQCKHFKLMQTSQYVLYSIGE